MKKIIMIYKKLFIAVKMECKETLEMVQYFLDFIKQRLSLSNNRIKLSSEKARKAWDQLRDIPKILPFFLLCLIPIPGITEGYLLLTVFLEKKADNRMSLLPSQFRGIF